MQMVPRGTFLALITLLFSLLSLSTIILNNIEEAPVRGQAPATRVVHHPGTKHRACWQQ